MITTYMNYSVCLTSDTDYNTALSLSGGSSLINKAPRTLAGILGIPYPYPTGDLTTISKTILFYFPFTPGQEFLLSPGGATGIFVDDTVDFQIVHQNPGNPPTIWASGQDTKYIWTANIVKANGSAGTAPDSITAIPQRRWIGGSEWAPMGEGGDGVHTQSGIRDASRTISGRGLAIRGNNSAFWRRYVDEYRIGLAPVTSWERFYVRFRNLPSVSDMGFWRCHGISYFDSGFALKFNTIGEVEGFNVDTGGNPHNEGVVWTPTLDVWYLIDILFKYGSGGATLGTINIYVNHVLTYQCSVTGGAIWGLNYGPTHRASTLGNCFSGTDKDCEIDLDDWICADLPGNLDPTTLAPIDPINENWPIDWSMGSHVRKHYNTAIIPGTFVGNLGVLNQGVSPEMQLTNILTSSTSGDLLEGITDVLALGIQDTIAAILGPVAGIVSLFSSNVANTDGKLGYKIAGGAAVLTTIDQNNTAGWNSIGYLPSGLIIPTEITPFSVVHSKSVDINLDTTFAMVVVVEYIGVWGSEDYPTFNYPISRITNLHNCRCENTGWGYFGAVPSAPVYSMGGTYIGNGTYQEIILPIPGHFLWIRAVTGGNAPIVLFGASLEGNLGIYDRVIPNIRLFTDSLGVTKFSVSGNDVDVNKTGVTFQYIVFCDPGMRFNLCGEFHHNSAASVPKVNYLIDPLFTPECGFVQSQICSNLSSTTGLSFKGLGQAGNVGNLLDGTSKNNWGNFAAGIINSLADLHASSLPNSYSLWRTSEPGCSGVMIQSCSYTGDGNAHQVINLTPVSGRFPLFVMVIPASGSEAYFKDPSHVGADSSVANLLTIRADAIESSDIDQITVGVTLNTNGVVYQIFCLPGSDIGMLNGIYYNVNCDPPLTYHIVPNNLDGDVIVIGDGGLDLGGNPLSPTDIIANQDLSGIYTIVPGQTHDILQDRLVGQPTINFKIPNPYFKTGYIGG